MQLRYIIIAMVVVAAVLAYIERNKLTGPEASKQVKEQLQSKLNEEARIHESAREVDTIEATGTLTEAQPDAPSAGQITTPGDVARPATPAEEAAVAAGEENSCNKLADMLVECAPYTCKQAHPVEPGVEVTHTIQGVLENGLCAHSQSTATQVVICNYSAGMRNLMVASLRGQASDQDNNMLSLSFAQECQVFQR